MDNLPQEHYLQQEEIYLSFISQLKKDAAMSNIEINDSILSSNLSELIDHFNLFIEKLLQQNNGYERVQAWLYRVDVPQRVIKEKMNISTKKYSEIIAEVIIKRTLQKVVIRYLYSNKP